MQQRFLISLIAPFLAYSGFLQAPAIANLKSEPIFKETKSPLPTLQVHGDIQRHQPLSDSLTPLLSLSPEQAGVAPFQPNCQTSDQLCTVWTEFRTPYPYPTQRIAAKVISDDEMVIIISEPSNRLNKQQWQDFMAVVFADDLLEYRTFRWMIGFDGWVEDIVVRVRNADLPQDDLLSHNLTRDRIALINMAMFGSAAGTRVERIESSQSPENISQLPNLQVSAIEVLDWVTDQGIGWQALDTSEHAVSHWSDPTFAETRQVLISADQTLVLFTFPISDIVTARNTGSLPAELKTVFRAFAVSSDVLIGGAWSNDQVAILARARQVPLEDFPPLRVETFELIATQKTTELYQSYERNNLFAGKLETGEYALRDWAPVYLSPTLINTELGALLNITDQMLKSWSQAGQVEYLYFDYPHKPITFPFNGIPLSEVVFEKTGSSQVLFNWNTTGMGSVISGNPSILIPTQTGALPVTYGSELEQGGEIQTGHLQQYEEEAYEYFANLQDPNLATVAQYTLLYQILLAAAPIQAENLSSQAMKGAQVLTNYALSFIREIDTTNSLELVNAREWIRDFRATYPDVDDQQLAALLADPRTGQTQFLNSFGQEFDQLSEIDNALVERINQFNSLATEFNRKQESLQNGIDQFNSEVDRVNRQGGASPSESARLDEWRASLEREQQELGVLDSNLVQLASEIERLENQLEDIGASLGETVIELSSLSSTVQQLVTRLQEPIALRYDLDQVRTDFSNAHAAAADSWVKTPATVLSWRNEGGRLSLSSVGGHNLDSQALRFEESSSVNTLQVVETDSGRVLQYPPGHKANVLANASELARQIEHRGITDPQILSQVVQRPADLRPRQEALALGEIPSSLPVGQETDVALVGELQALAEANDCCLFVASGDARLAYLADPNPSPPPPALVTGFEDTPTLHQAIANRLNSPASRKPIVLLGDRGQADAIARSIDTLMNQSANTNVGQMGWLRQLADFINRPATSGDAITVLGFSRRNNLVSLEVSTGTESVSRAAVDSVVQGLSARLQPNTTNVQAVPHSEIELQLPARWQQAADQGQLAIIRLSYVEQGPINRLADVYISGLAREPEQVPMVQERMLEATNDVLEDGIGQETTASEVVIDLKEEIEEQLQPLSDEQVEMLLKREQDAYYITDHSPRNSDG